MNNTFRRWRDDKDRADHFWPFIKGHLRSLSHLLIDYEITTEEEDIGEAADYKIQATSGTIAARVRFDNVLYRDLTLRSWRKSGAETELAKIRRGYARWYYYAWANGHDLILDWMLVDLDGLRASGLLEPGIFRERLNLDGLSAFIPIPRSVLAQKGLVLASQEGQLLLFPSLNSSPAR